MLLPFSSVIETNFNYNNKIMNVEGEIKFYTVISDILEINNPTFKNFYRNF